jgi:hypothetical protein
LEPRLRGSEADFALTPEKRRELQEELSRTLAPEEARRDPRTYFLPLAQHRDLLQRHIIVVVGERGTGKTALFRFLSSLRGPAEISQAMPGLRTQLSWCRGYAEAPEFPAASTLTAWMNKVSPMEMESMWRRLLLARLSREDGLPPVPTALQAAMACLDPDQTNHMEQWAVERDADRAHSYTWLDRVEEALVRQGRTIILGYDDLDLIGEDDELRGAATAVEGLLRLWLPLSRRLERVQARIFLRPDLFNLAQQTTRDASKVGAQSIELRWTGEDVFRVMLRHIGASESLRTWLAQGPQAITFKQDALLGHLPPPALPEIGAQLPLFQPIAPNTVQSQKDLAARLAGEVMGSGLNKGYTYQWILNHSQDGLARHLPRVTLNLLRHAALDALASSEAQPRGSRLLLPAHLVAAQARAGKERLSELREHPGDKQLIDRLELSIQRREAPLPWAEVVELLHHSGQTDPETTLNHLRALGIVLRRPARAPDQVDRLDLPEIFRTALNMVRKGGPLQIPRAPA